MYWFLASAHALLVLALTIRILYREDVTRPARLAWFIAFASLPGIGSIIYLLLGEVYISKSLVQRHERVMSSVSQLGPQILGQRDQSLEDIAPQHRDAFHYTATINGFTTTRGNRFELLDDSQAFRSRLIEDIDAANECICILYYIWLEDQTGTQVAEAVARAAGRGINCRIMIDDIGSRKFMKSGLWTDMKKAGAHCSIAMPVERIGKLHVFNRFDLRNHRKITVIDGRIAYCGSQNCADPEFRPKRKYAPWVDIMTRVEGPAVNQMQALFATDWLTAGADDSLDDFTFNAQPIDGGCIAQVRGTGPLKRRFSAVQSFVAAIHGARHELTITTPYFVPDNTVLNALSKASFSGVDVTLNVPARNDSWVVSAACRSTYSLLLRAGVRIQEYQPGLLHSKIMTIDGVFTIIGSSNLDLRSFDLNYENDMLIYDQATTAAIRARQACYLAESIPVETADVDAWSSARRIWYNVIGTLGPIL